MNKLTKYISAIILQVSILFLVILFKYIILSGGTEVLFHVAPIDPTDPLRGDYIVFKYSQISEIDDYLISGRKPSVGDTIYVFLYKSGKTWHPINATTISPEDSDELFIKGRVERIQNNFDSNYHRVESKKYIVKYGIEEYFIPEGTGSDYSAKNYIYARVAIDDSGNSVLKKLEVENHSSSFSPR